LIQLRQIPLHTTLLVILAYTALWSQEGEEEPPGYELLADQVRIQVPEHWSVWKAPTGARLIRPDGTVEPRLLRGSINAVFNAETDSVIARIRRAGTSRMDAPLVLDGDAHTFWEPDRGDPLSGWLLEIDMGRTVTDGLVLSPSPQVFAIYDLTGRQVRQGYAGADESGRFVRIWDARDAAGERVPPGLYIYRVEVQADAETMSRQGLVSVAY